MLDKNGSISSVSTGLVRLIRGIYNQSNQEKQGTWPRPNEKRALAGTQLGPFSASQGIFKILGMALTQVKSFQNMILNIMHVTTIGGIFPTYRKISFGMDFD
ncbi:MAG: hypothetical protein LBL95_02395 [Deltaproteobacteria bacterium]|jgi:hypothetical protein|nr:hypothetical protein [Deltaproteobacteria bacterium]